MKKQTFFGTIFLLILVFIPILSINHDNKIDLEIYTTEDIYYINGLIVTSENGEEEKIFKNQKELKKFISDITAQDSNTCQELVYKLDLELGNL